MSEDDKGIEQQLIQNVINNYDKALNNKVYLDYLNNKNLTLNLGNDKSLYMYSGMGNKIDMRGKCNHIFMYDCKDMNMRISDCVSGLTCINCHDCNFMFKHTPMYNIEISNSTGINMRSLFYNMPIVHMGVSMNIIKSVDYVVHEYYNVNSGYFSNWSYNFFNF